MKKFFAVQIAIGLAMILWGLVVVPAISYEMLDFVLAPDEFRDVEVSTETLRKLSQMRWLERWPWVGAGAVVAGVGGLGLIQGRRV